MRQKSEGARVVTSWHSMIVLHALYDPGNPHELLFFGESPPDVQAQTSSAQKQRGRKSKTPLPVLHPFATSSGVLRTLFSGLIAERDRTPESAVMTISIPVRQSVPVGSPCWQQEFGQSDDPPDGLNAFSVPVLNCPLTTFLLLYPHFAGGPSPQFVAGGTLTFWTAVARLALDIVAGERFIPAFRIVSHGNILIFWEVVPSHEDAETFEALESAIPQICIPRTGFRAFDPGPDPVPVKEILLSFGSGVIQSCVELGIQQDHLSIRLTHSVMDLQQIQFMYLFALTGQGKVLGFEPLLPDNSPETRKLVNWMSARDSVNNLL